MFLHLGADTVISFKNIIAISDYRSFKSIVNREFLKKCIDDGRVVDISDNNPKSYVVTSDKVYISAISSITLKKRSDNMFCNEE